MNWFFELPPSLQSVIVLVATTLVLLNAGVGFGKRPFAYGVIGFVGLFLASQPGWTAGPESIAIVGTLALAALGWLLLPLAEIELPSNRIDLGCLLLLGAAGTIVLGTATHVLSMVLGLETLSLAVAVACGFGRGKRALEAAFKFFLMGSLGLGVLVYGTGLFVYATGSFTISAPPLAGMASVHRLACLMLALGLCFELAVVPVHFGSLAAYMAMPPAVAAFATTASKLGAGLALLRFTAAAPDTGTGSLLQIVGLCSVAWGTLAGLAQRNLRSVLAWSAVAHAGFLTVALGCGAAGRQSAVLYLVTYAASSALVFAALAGRDDASLTPEGLRQRPLGPVRAVAAVLGLLSLAGMPPTPGLWAKVAVLMPAWSQAGLTFTIVLALFGVLGAVYYLRLVPDLVAGMRDAQERTPALVRVATLVGGAAVVALLVLPWLGTRLAAMAAG